MTRGALPNRFLLPAILTLMLSYGRSARAQVSAIYSDYGGFWTTSSSSVNSTKPDNSHNLLAFTWNGTTFSTGVSDATLTSHSVAFTPLMLRAFPITTVPNTAGGAYYVMLGQLYDGVNNGVSSPAPFPANPTGAQLATFLTDGPRGLNLGTGLANIPAGTSLRFDLSSNGISLSSINDGIPDIFVTEEASPTSSNPDVFSFVDASGHTVGTAVSVVTSSLTPIGNWLADFYDLTGTQTSSSFINQTRPLAYYAADLSTFGINATNYMNAVALIYQPNGTSDPAFIAFNEPSISIATQVYITAQPTTYTNNVTLSSVPTIQLKDGLGRIVSQSGIPVTVSIATGTATLSGTLTVNTDASGIATFSDLSLAGSGNVSLKFSSTSLDPGVTGNLNPVSLPLNWLSFTGENVWNGILLRWTTSGERNTKDFIVQRSNVLAAWQDIGTIPATGSLNTNTYQFTDNSPAPGANDYRIRQRDMDGNSTFSLTVAVGFSTLSPAAVTIYPNPVSGGTVYIELPHAALVTLYNADGIPVLRKQMAEGTQRLAVGYLARGFYSLVIDNAAYKVEIL